MSLERESHPSLTPLASRNGRTSLHYFPMSQDKEVESTILKTFPISFLPGELRDGIYAYYFASLPPLSITPDNATLLLHQNTQLSLSSPYFKFDVLPSIFYSNCSFSFSSPKVLRQFANGAGTKKVAKVRIEYGKLSRCHHTDWVFLLFQNFENLKEVTFVLQVDRNGVDSELFEQWWECVRDAMREASNSRAGDMGKGNSTGVMLKIEYGEWGVFWERVGGC